MVLEHFLPFGFVTFDLWQKEGDSDRSTFDMFIHFIAWRYYAVSTWIE